DELEAQLAVIWEDLLQVRPIGVTDDFFDLGGHSLLAVRLAARIEQKWGRSLALSDLLVGSTIEELASRLREPVKSRTVSSLIPLGASGAGQPLFLVHPIGGGVLCYNALARCLDGARAVLGLQAAGLDGEVEPEADLVHMASRYVDAVLAEHPEGPYLLGGWSMGGVVALEMAMQLSAAGRDVPLVFLIDCSAPVPRHTPHAIDDRESLVAFVADLSRTAGRPTWTSPEHFRNLDPESIRDGSLDQSRLGREIAGEIGSERFRRLHDVYRANRLALDGYQPRTYSGRIILIRAESSRSDFEGDPTRGWDDLAVGGITTYHVSGDHYTILQQPAVERLAEILAGEIEGLKSPTGKIHPQ
ncbi:MAG TPA: alpha/beta fold hydrolase, partial [Isosphaeraceae bacterium]|nr:alpha/beta fold hydrolase [Isosphaeraceae bacterium]